jgi:hypothetical protein
LLEQTFFGEMSQGTQMESERTEMQKEEEKVLMIFLMKLISPSLDGW